MISIGKQVVMRGLDPRIHPEIDRGLTDCQVKPGNEEFGSWAELV